MFVCLFNANHNFYHWSGEARTLIPSFQINIMGKKNKNKKVKTETGGSGDAVAVAPPQKKKKSKLEDQNLDDFLDNWDIDSEDEMGETLGEDQQEEEEQNRGDKNYPEL